MKNLKFYLLSCLILTAFTYIGCDDAGVILPFVAKGKVGFSETHLKTLDPNIDGMYEIWVKLDSSGVTSWSSCGRFNVNSTGTTIDANGNPAVFQFTGDTNRLQFATRMLLTVEKVNNVFPSAQVLMSGPLSVTADSVFGDMSISGPEAFGDVGTKFGENAPGRYVRWSPTTNNANPSQGIWFCDTNGVSQMPQGLVLPSDGGWIYQAWLVDRTNNTYRSMGKFFDPNGGADDDFAGPCAGPENGFNAIGQDWIQTGGSCGSTINVISGTWGILVTIEPSNEARGSLEESTPSFFKVWSQNIDPSLGIGQVDYLHSVYNTDYLPKASIKITN